INNEVGDGAGGGLRLGADAGLIGRQVVGGQTVEVTPDGGVERRAQLVGDVVIERAIARDRLDVGAEAERAVELERDVDAEAAEIARRDGIDEVARQVSLARVDAEVVALDVAQAIAARVDVEAGGGGDAIGVEAGGVDDDVGGDEVAAAVAVV